MEGPTETMTLLQIELIGELASAFPDEIAWRNVADRSAMTLATWHRRSNQLARGLQGRGVTSGDRVALQIGQDEPLEWLVSYVAIHKAGAVAVPLLSRLGAGELTRVLQHAGASVALCSGRNDGSAAAGGAERVLDIGRQLERVVVTGRQRPASRSHGRRRRGRHVHIGHHRSAQRRRGDPRQPLDGRARARSLARARLPLRLSVRDD